MPDPYLTLGVARDADDQRIHQAYLEAVRRCPPDRDPKRFQAVRAAYETIRTQKLRLEYQLFNADLPTPVELLERVTRSSDSARPSIDTFRSLLRDSVVGPKR